MCNNPNVDLVNMNAYIKFGDILSNFSQDIERKQNYDGMTIQIKYSPPPFQSGAIKIFFHLLHIFIP